VHVERATSGGYGKQNDESGGTPTFLLEGDVLPGLILGCVLHQDLHSGGDWREN
jgi:hypothetical protein